MTHTTAIDERLTELEIKASFTEDLLEQLNQVIVRQQHHIDHLIDAVQQLRQQQTQSSTSGGGSNPRDELPPHY